METVKLSSNDICWPTRTDKDPYYIVDKKLPGKEWTYTREDILHPYSGPLVSVKLFELTLAEHLALMVLLDQSIYDVTEYKYKKLTGYHIKSSYKKRPIY